MIPEMVEESRCNLRCPRDPNEELEPSFQGIHHCPVHGDFYELIEAIVSCGHKGYEQSVGEIVNWLLYPQHASGGTPQQRKYGSNNDRFCSSDKVAYKKMGRGV